MKLADLVALIAFHFRNLLGRPHSRTVLDVGSGHRPHGDATHLVDLFLEGNAQRGKTLRSYGRTVIQADVEALPFKDKAFVFVWASHVLEHTTDPARACNELMRVAHAGYIETPSPFYEQGYNYPNPKRGWPFHNWYVWLKNDDTLVFEPKTAGSIDTYCDCRYSGFVRSLYKQFPDLNTLHKFLPRECNYTVLRWKESFHFEVRG